MQLTGTFLDWIAVIGMVIVGLVSIYGLLDRENRKRQNDNDAADDRLIKLLQGTVDSLEKQVNELTTQVGELGNKVTKLQAENGMLRSILQGRDENTKAEKKAYQEAIVIVEENNTFVKQNAKNIEKTNKNIERIAKLMEEHMGVVQKIVEKK